jgi:hypothetical protein
LRKAAECKGGSASLSEIAANIAPLLVARKRLHDQMKAYKDGTLTATDKSTPWERCPWKHDAAADAGETHRFHLLAQCTDVADLAIERLPANKKADHRLLRLTKPRVKDAEFVNGAWQFTDQSRPGSARAAPSGPCSPSMNGRIRRSLTPTY